MIKTSLSFLKKFLFDIFQENNQWSLARVTFAVIILVKVLIPMNLDISAGVINFLAILLVYIFGGKTKFNLDNLTGLAKANLPDETAQVVQVAQTVKDVAPIVAQVIPATDPVVKEVVKVATEVTEVAQQPE